jgi:tellurite resistance protein
LIAAAGGPRAAFSPLKIDHVVTTTPADDALPLSFAQRVHRFAHLTRQKDESMTSPFSPGDALVAAMLTTSAADERVSDAELRSIMQIVDALPAFRDYDTDRIHNISAAVVDMLEAEDGLDAIIGLVKDALPDELNETAYALACDVAAADGNVPMSERRWLEMLRRGLSVGRLTAAAIERGARARHLKLPA